MCFVYRSEFDKSQAEKQPADLAPIKMSLAEIIESTQNQLSQMVFMFSDQNLTPLDGNEYTQIQEVLKDCAIFSDQGIEVVPKYKFFQIKKSQIPNSKRLLLQFIDISAKIFYDDLKAQEEYMNITTSSVSHEMRNPLNSIIAQCTIMFMILAELLAFINAIRHKLTPAELEQLTSIRERLEKSVTIMKTSAQLLMFNVEDVLGMAHIRAKKFKKVVSEFSVRKCLEEVMSIQMFKAEQLHVELRAEVAAVDTDFDGERDDLIVATDEKRFQQILVNLQSNALKFTKAGGSVVLRATFVPAKQEPGEQGQEFDLNVSSLVDEQVASQIGSENQRQTSDQSLEAMLKQTTHPRIVVEVQDTGVGIKAEDQKKLFKMFTMLRDTRQMNSNGVGLGLFICKQIVEQFGGSISIKSEVNVGSSFFFCFEIDSFRIERRPESTINESFCVQVGRDVPESDAIPQLDLSSQIGLNTSRVFD